MASKRKDRIEGEIALLERAIAYAKHMGFEGTKCGEDFLERVRVAYDQGSWGSAERMLDSGGEYKGSEWFKGYLAKVTEAGYNGGTGIPRFEGDGLCKKLGHNMVQIKLSQVRWFYKCTWCGKQGKSASIKG